MKLENTFEVVLDGAKFIFPEPSLQDWVVMQNMQSKKFDEQADLVLGYLISTEGVDIDVIRSKKPRFSIYTRLVRGWTDAVVALLTGEAEAKNDESTPG